MNSREVFHINSVELEGLVVKVWARRDDIYARMATYDQHAEVISTEGKGDLPRRQAHYVTVLLRNGKTADGRAVSLGKQDRVRVTGFIREIPYTETLRQIKVRASAADKVADGDDDVVVHRISTYVVAESLVQFG